jgi:hypothetical protein
MTALTSQPPVLPVRTIRLHRPLIAVSVTMAFLSLIGIGWSSSVRRPTPG